MGISKLRLHLFKRYCTVNKTRAFRIEVIQSHPKKYSLISKFYSMKIDQRSRYREPVFKFDLLKIVAVVTLALLCRPSFAITDEQPDKNPTHHQGEKLLTKASPPLPEKTVTGTVTDERGEGLPGVTIQIKGVPRGTTTEADGTFSITLSPEENVLILSFVGYLTEEIDVKNRVLVTVSLKPTDNSLNEIVVIGYGTQKRKDLTGSVASVSANVLRQPVNSFDKVLQGAVSGALVTSTSGQPGAGVSIKIRGASSIQGGTEPLFIIDGFPLYDANLSFINPSDIASIDVLKDASATAIYGSRGANGVVIVTTKKGREGKVMVNYEGSYGVESVRRKIPLVNAPEFARLRNEALFDRTPSGGPNQYLSEEEIARLGEGTNWQNEAFVTAPTHNHLLAVSGGNSKTRFHLSTGYFNQNGTIINTGFERFNLRLNLDTEITDRLKSGVNFTGNISSRQNAPSGTVSALLTMPPTATIYNADGSYTLRNPFENIISNPIASLHLETNEDKSLRALATAYAEYEVISGLRLRVSLGTDLSAGKQNSYQPSTVYQGSLVNGRASIDGDYSLSWLNENTLTYYKNLGSKHSINALVGFTQQVSSSESFSQGSTQFISDDLLYHGIGSGAVVTTPSSGYQGWGLMSYLSRVNYNYNDRYLLTGSIRFDGSSRFGRDKKWGAFPSAAFSWKISNEDFFGVDPSLISDLKLRASYGATGNQEIGLYQSLSTLGNDRYLIGDNIVIGYSPNRIANDLLGWEKTNQFDLGFDFSLLSNRIHVTADAYLKRTRDLLLNVEIPWTTGHSSSLQNFGSIENKGLEFGIQSRNLARKLTWNSEFNISFNRSKVLQINDFEEGFYLSGNYIVQVGKPLGSFYGTVTDGVLQAGEEETRGKLTGKTNPKPGDRVYKDIDGNDAFSNATDRTIIGTAQPDFIFGFQNHFTWKQFDLSVFLQGICGGHLLNGNKQTLEFLTGSQNASAIARDRWSPDNTDTEIPRASGDPSNFFSNRFVEDASYLRLRNITLGYTLPTPGNSPISSLRIYFTAQNLLTLTNYTGFDPDVSHRSNVSPGSDSGNYPVPRLVSGGVSLNF